MQNNNNLFSILVKPCSSDCNLNCDYCFYLEKAKLYPNSVTHRMSREILDKLVSSYLNTDQDQYVFIWQGGEPLLMGLDFFKKVISLQQKYGKSGSLITNVVQTNATLISNDWAKFFKEFNFLIGVSIDGSKDLHNIYRRNDSIGSYDKVIKGINILQNNQVNFNALIAVHKENIGSPVKIFEHLIDLNIFYHQYIPIVEFDKYKNPLPWTITNSAWGEFLIKLFDVWNSKYLKKVSIRIFDLIINYLTTGKKSICSWNKDCFNYYVVEYNGDIYPCDFFVEKSYRLGNIANNNWIVLHKSKIRERFSNIKSNWNQTCQKCKYLQLCMGDCPKYRQNCKSYLCEGWKMFFDYSLPKIESIIKAYML